MSKDLEALAFTVPIPENAVRQALQAAADAFAKTLGVVSIPEVEDFSIECRSSTAEARLQLTLAECWNLFARVSRDTSFATPGHKERMTRVRELLDELHAIAERCRYERNTWVDERIRKHEQARKS